MNKESIAQLASELKILGGGSVQVSNHRVVCILKAADGAHTSSIVRQEGEILKVRDPKAPDGNKHSAERCFRVPLCIYGEPALNEEICKVTLPTELST